MFIQKHLVFDINNQNQICFSLLGERNKNDTSQTTRYKKGQTEKIKEYVAPKVRVSYRIN